MNLQDDSKRIREWDIEYLSGEKGPSILEFIGQHPLLILFFNYTSTNFKNNGIEQVNNISNLYPGLKIIGIHTTNKGINLDAHFIDQIRNIQKTSFRIFKDKDSTSADAYEVVETPHWLLLDKNGTTVKSFSGCSLSQMQNLDYHLMELIGLH